MRPNAATLQLLSKYRDILPIGRYNKQHLTEAANKSKTDFLDGPTHENKKSHTDGLRVEKNPDRKVIAMYVRRGAKGIEMALKPFLDYASAALILSKNGLMNVTGESNRNTNTNTTSTASTHVNMNSEEPENFNATTASNNSAHKHISVAAFRQSSSSSSSSSHAQDRLNERVLKPVIFLGTEDPAVIDEALVWGRDNVWQASAATTEMTYHHLCNAAT